MKVHVNFRFIPPPPPSPRHIWQATTDVRNLCSARSVSRTAPWTIHDTDLYLVSMHVAMNSKMNFRGQSKIVFYFATNALEVTLWREEQNITIKYVKSGPRKDGDVGKTKCECPVGPQKL